jgi:hypothetical protein
MKTTPEVYVSIRFHNGDLLERRFDFVEHAWRWEEKTRNAYANRRAKADRLEVKLSLYAGCTVTGKSYGGILHGTDPFGTELTSRLRYEEARQAKLQPALV